jgi:hypothetical protein
MMPHVVNDGLRCRSRREEVQNKRATRSGINKGADWTEPAVSEKPRLVCQPGLKGSYLVLEHQRAYLRLNLSTRPAVSSTFCFPV